MRAAGGVVSAEELLEKGWGTSTPTPHQRRSITVSTLRAKLGRRRSSRPSPGRLPHGAPPMTRRIRLVGRWTIRARLTLTYTALLVGSPR